MRRVLLPHHIADDPALLDGALRAFGGVSMGTSWSVRLVDPGAGEFLPQWQQGLQAQLDDVVAQMSHWEVDSNLGRFNRAPAGSWHVLPPAFFDVLSFAISVAEQSGGAYDPCAGAIVNAWGFGPSGRHDEPGFVAPDANRIAALRAQRAAQRVELDPARRAARQPGGILLDLSAVAKGYGVDRLAHYLQSQGVRHFLVEVGGELRGAGVKPDGQPWWVALEQVDDGALSLARAPGEMVLALHGLSVATSGDYRRYFVDGEQRYSHTIDPRSAAPIDNGLASVTVLHPQCMAADAWSTALTVLGPERGMALAERQGLAARFVLRDGACLSERLTSHLRAMLDDD
ncbi:MAG: FAD:protein FMN transferase [Pseudomonadota bacterium]